MILWSCILVLAVIITGLCWALIRMDKELQDTRIEVTGLRSAYTDLRTAVGLPTGPLPDHITDVLTDPVRLDAELERSANLTEMRRARRRHMPREDAGPPAKVKRMKIYRNKRSDQF